MIEAVEKNGLSNQEEFYEYMTLIDETSKLIGSSEDNNLQLIVKRIITYGKDAPSI